MQSLDLHSVTTWRDALMTSFQNAFDQVIAWTPKVVGMVLVLVVGYLVARLLDKFVTALAHSLGLETAAERSGLTASMRQAGIQRSVPWILGRLVFWLSMCVFVSAAFNILGLETVSSAMETIVAYIPHVLVATVVIVVGLLVATFLRGVIATSADRVGITYADNLANACYYVIALMTFIGAFDQLGIQFGLLKELILIAFAAVALGFGLAFGLGGREVMGGILAGYYTRQRLQTGDHVTVAGMSGTVREVGTTATVIETDEGGLINRHSVPNIKMLNEAVR
jgi:small-conductance mechanosensitive channel